ncbi:MAG: TolB family protein, partial [Acidobacteriota bacterium]
MDEKEKKEKKPDPWVIDRLQFKRDNIGYLDRRRTHLYVFDLETKETSQITSGDYDDSQAAWSPDGKLVAFVSNRTEEPDGNSNSDIWIVSADNSDKGKTLLQVTTNPGSDTQPSWSPDGAQLCYVTVTEPEILWYATSNLAVVSSRGGTPRLLAKSLDRNVSSPRFSTDGDSILFLLEDSAERHLARIDLGGGELTRPISGSRSIRAFRYGKHGEIVALNSEPHLPPEIFALKGGELHQLSKANGELLAR